jgi:DNA-binding PucR family transcriptional regulator
MTATARPVNRRVAEAPATVALFVCPPQALDVVRAVHVPRKMIALDDSWKASSLAGALSL